MTKNSFEGYQENKQVAREALLATFLAFLGSSRMRFKHVTQLAELAADHLTVKQEANCNPSTLLRNPRYKRMLLTYMADHLEGGKGKRSKIVDPAAKVALIGSDLAVSNLRAEVERLKGYVVRLEEERTLKPVSSARKSVTKELQATIQPSEDRLKYVSVCRALHLVISRLENIVLVDDQKCEILDGSDNPPSVIVLRPALNSGR